MRRCLAAVAVAALLALTGCTGDSETPHTRNTLGMPQGGSHGPQDPEARTYPTSRAVIAAVNDYMRCDPILVKDPDVYADESVTCAYQAARDRVDVMEAATFTDEIQQESAMRYFRCDQEPTQGRGVVYGDGWLLVVDGRIYQGVMAAIGGRWAGPLAECTS